MLIKLPICTVSVHSLLGVLIVFKLAGYSLERLGCVGEFWFQIVLDNDE